MRVGLMGFGKTGKAVASTLLRHKDFELNWVVRRSLVMEKRSVAEFLGEHSSSEGVIYSIEHITIEQLLTNHPVDLIIDFSSETGLDFYGQEAAQAGITIISAVSHYPKEKLQLLKRLAKMTRVFWSPNITLGVNYMMLAARFLKDIAPWVDFEIVEEHFRDKKGASGTAQVMAKKLAIAPKSIKSVRAGGIIGRHEIVAGFPYQTVRFVHESITREAFGSGAIFVAENLRDKPKGFYNFEDLLLPYFNRRSLDK